MADDFRSVLEYNKVTTHTTLFTDEIRSVNRPQVTQIITFFTGKSLIYLYRDVVLYQSHKTHVCQCRTTKVVYTEIVMVMVLHAEL